MLALTHVLIVHRSDNQQVIHVSGHPDREAATKKADAVGAKNTASLRAVVWPIAEINEHCDWLTAVAIQM